MISVIPGVVLADRSCSQATLPRCLLLHIITGAPDATARPHATALQPPLLKGRSSRKSRLDCAVYFGTPVLSRRAPNSPFHPICKPSPCACPLRMYVASARFATRPRNRDQQIAQFT